MSLRVLFILKERFVNYGAAAYDENGNFEPYGYNVSSGLLNSARFVNEMLKHNGIHSHLVQVLDNNAIDREVHNFRPDVVVIEAFWVVPEKFEVLRKLHPNVKWIIRSHSEVPFLANEGNALDWAQKYLDQKNVFLSFNSKRATDDFISYFLAKNPLVKKHHIENRVVFLPNYYPVGDVSEPYRLYYKDTVDIGGFGAIRPMKNQLLQAFAAVEFSRISGYRLRYHINAPRIEQNGDNVLKNIRSLFAGLDDSYELVEHDWVEHHEFVKLVREMDIGLQVSFSETFNIVAADFVNNGVPMVGSEEIPFLFPLFQADMTDAHDIVKRMEYALLWKRIFRKFDPNKMKLNKYTHNSEKRWLEYLENFEA